MKASCWFDGGSRARSSPHTKGHAGCAIVLTVETASNNPIERTKYIGEATNNVAEYEGLMLAMRTALAHGVDDIQLISDSKLVVEQVLGAWKVNDARLKIICAEAQEMATQFIKCEILHVRRELNKDADRLVTDLLDEKSGKKR